MFVVHVNIHVKEGCRDAFIAATLDNVRHSLEEPGIARFDFMQHADDPHRFILVEAYYTTADPARHKETAHYQRWRETVADMMAEPRSSVKTTSLAPADQEWA